MSVEEKPVTKTNEKAEFSPNKAQKSTTQKDPQNAKFHTQTENSSPPTSLNIDDIDTSKLRQLHHPHSHEKTRLVLIIEQLEKRSRPDRNNLYEVHFS